MKNFYNIPTEPSTEQHEISERITGYTLYSAKQKRKTIKNNLPEFFPDLPNEKYDIIYADPPWDYGGKMQFDKSCIGLREDNIDSNQDLFISAANFKYPTVKIEDLKKMPIQSISSDDSLLFMWVTNPHLEQGIELGKYWGFKYRTVAFVWNKMVHNPGQYTLSFCELCLVFKRGRIPKPRGARNIKQLIETPRSAHSKKPDEVRRGIEDMFPSQKKIELFARSKSSGWDAWGLEADTMYENLPLFQ